MLILMRRSSKKRRSPKIRKREIHKQEIRRPKNPQQKFRTSRNLRAVQSNAPRPPHANLPRVPAHRVISVRPATTALNAPVPLSATAHNVSRVPATIVRSARALHVRAPHATTVPRVPARPVQDLPVHAHRVLAAHPGSAVLATTVRNAPDRAMIVHHALDHPEVDHPGPAPRVADHPDPARPAVDPRVADRPEVDHPVAAPAQDHPAADRVKADSKYRSPVAPQIATPIVQTGQAFHRAPVPLTPSTPPP
jgi:hypothetical protein